MRLTERAKCPGIRSRRTNRTEPKGMRVPNDARDLPLAKRYATGATGDKCAKAATIATARKLLTQLDACIKDGRDYELRSPA